MVLSLTLLACNRKHIQHDCIIDILTRRGMGNFNYSVVQRVLSEVTSRVYFIFIKMTQNGSPASAARKTLEEICEMEEMHKKTPVTSSILATANILMRSEKEKLDSLVLALRKKFQTWIKSTSSYKLSATKREKLWKLFHQFSLTDGYDLCIALDKSLDLNAHETFWQLFMEKEFLRQVINSLSLPQPSTSSAECTREVSKVEENAIRYAAGYVIRKLETKYSKNETESSAECTQALQAMAGKLHTRRSLTTHPSGSWTHLVDRGGLYHIEDMVYYLFLVLELLADQELNQLLQKGKGLEKLNKDKLSWLCENEEVQFIWCLVSVTVQEESIRQQLLRDIAYLWITTRIHSKLQKVKEDRKKAKAECVKGKLSLRKQLAK